MKFAVRRGLEEPEISLTSLIDVVFTLIIFFVVTTTFEDRAALEIALPQASQQVTPQPADPLKIVVDREGRYFIGANEVIKRDARSLQEAIARAAGDDRERPVLLQADARATHASVVTAMDALGQLGFVKIQIATVPETAGDDE